METNAGNISVLYFHSGPYRDILVYADDVYSDPPYVCQALDSLGYDYLCCYRQGADELMMMAYESSDPSFIIISYCIRYSRTPGLLDTAVYWIEYNFQDIIIATYDLDGSHTIGVVELFDFLDRFDVQAVSDLDSARTIYGWDAELRKGVPPLTKSNGHYIDNGDKLEAPSGEIAAGGFTATPQSGEIAIIKGISSKGNRFIINSYTFDNYDGDKTATACRMLSKSGGMRPSGLGPVQFPPLSMNSLQWKSPCLWSAASLPLCLFSHKRTVRNNPLFPPAAGIPSAPSHRMDPSSERDVRSGGDVFFYQRTQYMTDDVTHASGHSGTAD